MATLIPRQKRPSSENIEVDQGEGLRAAYLIWKRLSAGNAVWFFLLIGVLLRLRQYFYNRSLWLDESMLALNLIHRAPSELLKPLDYHQGAPVGFLILEKIVMRFLGSGEMALRLVPLLAGIASVFLFAVIVRKWLSAEAAAIAVGLFSLCAPLIYYSGEAKQYSSDAAVALALFLVASWLVSAQITFVKVVALSVISAVAIWFSQPAVFVVAGIGIIWLWLAIRIGTPVYRAGWLIFALITGASFATNYFLSLRSLTRDNPLLDYWNGAFAPMPFSVSGIRWYIETWLTVFNNPLGLTFAGIAIAALIVGVRELFRDSPRKLMLIILPILLGLAASALHDYPFRGRLLLFATPSFFILIAAGLSTIQKKTRGVLPGLGSVLVVLLFFHPVLDAAQTLRKPHFVEEIRPVLEYVQQHHAAGDTLYCYYDAQYALSYYTARGEIGAMPLIVGVSGRDDWTQYWHDLDRLRGRSRVWFLFSHVYREGGADEEKLFLDHLDRMGTRLDSVHANGAAAYLYDLSR